MLEWTTDLPTVPGRYFIRPAVPGPGRIRSHLITVSMFGDKLAAWGGPGMWEFFRVADLDRLGGLLGQKLQWAYVDAITDPSHPLNHEAEFSQDRALQEKP